MVVNILSALFILFIVMIPALFIATVFYVDDWSIAVGIALTIYFDIFTKWIRVKQFKKMLNNQLDKDIDLIQSSSNTEMVKKLNFKKDQISKVRERADNLRIQYPKKNYYSFWKTRKLMKKNNIYSSFGYYYMLVDAFSNEKTVIEFEKLSMKLFSKVSIPNLKDYSIQYMKKVLPRLDFYDLYNSVERI